MSRLNTSARQLSFEHVSFKLSIKIKLSRDQPRPSFTLIEAEATMQSHSLIQFTSGTWRQHQFLWRPPLLPPPRLSPPPRVGPPASLYLNSLRAPLPASSPAVPRGPCLARTQPQSARLRSPSVGFISLSMSAEKRRRSSTSVSCRREKPRFENVHIGCFCCVAFRPVVVLGGCSVHVKWPRGGFVTRWPFLVEPESASSACSFIHSWFQPLFILLYVVNGAIRFEQNWGWTLTSLFLCLLLNFHLIFKGIVSVRRLLH